MKQYTRRLILAVLVMALWLWAPRCVYAQIIDDVQISTQEDGYTVKLFFSVPLRYLSSTPTVEGEHIRIQLTPLNFNTLSPEDVSFLKRTESLPWNKETGAPIKDITFEGYDPQFPQIILQFTEHVFFVVKSSADARVLLINFKASSGSTPTEQNVETNTRISETISSNGQRDAEIQKALDEEITKRNSLVEAKKKLLEGQVDQAINIYNNMLPTAQLKEREEVLELLGYAYQRQGQWQQAKMYYEQYLNEFPQSQGVGRVQQRLAGLVTAPEEPKPALPEPVKLTAYEAKKPLPKGGTQYFGDISQFFTRDQTSIKGWGNRVIRSDLTTNLNLNVSRQHEQYDVLARFVGNHRNDFLRHRDDQNRVSVLSFEGSDANRSWFGKVGRQTFASAGGVLGRFDGAYLAHNISDEVKINTVVGFPVDATSQPLDIHRKFYSLSADMTIAELFNVTPYFVDQYNYNLTDRRAVGAQLRYFDRKKSFLHLMDYDVFYKQLNIFMLNGSYTTEGQTTFTFLVDYRKAPFLTTSNASQGQVLKNFKDILEQYNHKDIYQMARDRTTISKSATMGVAQQLNDDLQLTGEMTVSELEGTVDSAVGSGFEGTGLEYTYMTQLVSNDIFTEHNVLVSRLQFSDRVNDNAYSFSLDDRLPINARLLISPRFQMEYSDKKRVSGYRVTLRPSMRLEYHINDRLRWNFESGTEWLNEEIDNFSQQSTGLFVETGYQLSF